jgi:hypothetical protein
MLWLAAVGALATAAPPSIIFILSDDCELSYPRIPVRSRHCSHEHQHHGKLSTNTHAAFRGTHIQPSCPCICALAVGYGDYSLATEVNQSSFRIPTPNIERLAENGVRFSRGYSMQVCAPSRYLSLLSVTKLAQFSIMQPAARSSDTPPLSNPSPRLMSTCTRASSSCAAHTRILTLTCSNPAHGLPHAPMSRPRARRMSTLCAGARS